MLVWFQSEAQIPLCVMSGRVSAVKLPNQTSAVTPYGRAQLNVAYSRFQNIFFNIILKLHWNGLKPNLRHDGYTCLIRWHSSLLNSDTSNNDIKRPYSNFSYIKRVIQFLATLQVRELHILHIYNKYLCCVRAEMTPYTGDTGLV